MRRIFLLGHAGMLGQMVMRHFSNRPEFEVIPVDERYNQNNLIDNFRRYDRESPSVFINGIGAIPQKISRSHDFILPNILLPLELARCLSPKHQLIHPSTDCVFRGDRGQPYASSDEPDASDTYGWSKTQAERALIMRPNTVVIRTSIIGPSSSSPSGLLQWFLSQPERTTLSGFTNHLWNGMTTKQWCVEVEKLIASPNLDSCRLLQYGWLDGCSKYEMLGLFRDFFRPDIKVLATGHHKAIDRRLEPDILVPDLREQLGQLQTP